MTALSSSVVARIEVNRDQLIVEVAGADAAHRECTLPVPWQKATGKRRREILVPEGYRQNMRVRSARKHAPGWSHRLRGDAVGSRNLPLERAQLHKASRNGKAAASAKSI